MIAGTMIFKIHYFVFNAGLSGVLPLLTVFMQKYSDASSFEVGTLLMILPFIAVFTKPFFCALADRHRHYKLYFISALLMTVLGFGSYTVLPFYPDFIAQHGRAAWYILVVFTVLGFIAFGVAWSLGDAYAANVSHRTGESFGMIRLWGTVGWGVAGAFVGLIGPHLNLPELVFGFLIFIGSQLFEILLLIWWPNGQDFEMSDGSKALATEEKAPKSDPALAASAGHNLSQRQFTQQLATITEKPTWQPREEVVIQLSQLKSGELSTTRITQAPKSATTETETTTRNGNKDNLDKIIDDLVGATASAKAAEVARLAEAERRRISQLQMTIFKLVALKHKSLIKYLILFVALGTVFNIHWSFFFLHLEQLARDGKGAVDFSTLVGLCLVSQAVGETLCFMIAPWAVRKLGRNGAISLNAVAYVVRYFGNGLGIPLVSPYVAVLTESLQGINYGIFYYLVTDTALYYALLVDDIIPELHSGGLIGSQTSADQLAAVRTSLRATMQGVFSGAFDGLGFGLGSLIAGLLLEHYTYEELWCLAGAVSLAIFALHAVYELSSCWLRRGRRLRQLEQHEKCQRIIVSAKV